MATINKVDNTQFFLAAACGEKLYQAANYEDSDLYKPNDISEGSQVVVSNVWIYAEHMALNYFDNTNLTVFTVGITEDGFEFGQTDRFDSAEVLMRDLKIVAFNTDDDPLNMTRMAMQLMALLDDKDTCYIGSNGLLFSRLTPISDNTPLSIADLKKLEERLIHTWS